MAQFLTSSFSRVSPAVAQTICKTAKISTRAHPKRIGRQEADALYQAIQNTKIPAPATDCISPIGEPLILKGLHQQVPGEFFCAATRPPAVYRGNPFLIEVGLAYGASSPTQKVTLDALTELLAESDARSVRQFLLTTFDGLGPSGVERILSEARMGSRQTPAKLDEGGYRPASRRNEECESVGRAGHAGAAVCQSRAAAVSACSVRDHAVGDWQQLALLRAVAVPRPVAVRPCHTDGAHGQRLGAVHQRIEGSDRLVSRNHEGAAAWSAGRGTQARRCT